MTTVTDATKKPRVDILVPDGEIVTTEPKSSTATGYAADAIFKSQVTLIGEPGQTTRSLPDVPFKGAARPEKLPSGGSAFQDGFYGQLWTDLSMVLGDPVRSPTSQVYCGSGAVGTLTGRCGESSKPDTAIQSMVVRSLRHAGSLDRMAHSAL